MILPRHSRFCDAGGRGACRRGIGPCGSCGAECTGRFRVRSGRPGTSRCHNPCPQAVPWCEDVRKAAGKHPCEHSSGLRAVVSRKGCRAQDFPFCGRRNDAHDAKMVSSARPKMGRPGKFRPHLTAKPLIGKVGFPNVRILAKKHLCRADLRVNSHSASGGKASGSGSNEFRSYRI